MVGRGGGSSAIFGGEQFLFDMESLGPPKGKEKKKEDTPTFTITFAVAPEKGGEEPDDVRVKGGISDQAGRHLAFSEASITHMFFPTTGKLNLSISFVDSPFPKHHRCLLTLHIQEEKTQVSASRQTGNLTLL